MLACLRCPSIPLHFVEDGFAALSIPAHPNHPTVRMESTGFCCHKFEELLCECQELQQATWNTWSLI